MPLETYHGASLAPLLARARARLGPDALILDVRRLEDDHGRATYAVVAGDRAAAAPLRRGTPDGTMAPPADRPQRIAVIGPTGAGKTTTLAKLATHPRVCGGRRVGFLCLDTYRVGAVEQLQAYAELAGVPFAAAWTADEVAQALARFADLDAVLVDLPGRSPRARQDTAAIVDLLRQVDPTEVHLALPAGLQRAVARRMVADYRPHGVTHLLATKLDEAPDDATVFDLAADAGLPMRWYTDGQEVPTDIRWAADRLSASRAAGAARTGAPALEGVA